MPGEMELVHIALTTLLQEVRDMSTQTDALAAAVTAVQTEVANLNTQIANLTAQVTSLTAAQQQVTDDNTAMTNAAAALNALVPPASGSTTGTDSTAGS